MSRKQNYFIHKLLNTFTLWIYNSLKKTHIKVSANIKILGFIVPQGVCNISFQQLCHTNKVAYNNRRQKSKQFLNALFLPNLLHWFIRFNKKLQSENFFSNFNEVRTFNTIFLFLLFVVDELSKSKRIFHARLKDQLSYSLFNFVYFNHTCKTLMFSLNKI